MEFSNHTTSIVATTASNGTASSQAAPHRKNAAQRTRSDSPYQQRTSQKDNPTQVIIKQAVDYLIQQLEAGKSETLTAYLGAMARFHNYSFGNILAIARQRPTATRVAGFGTWKEMGRFVKKGEKGIQILAPMIGYRRKKDDAEQGSDASAKSQPMLIGFLCWTKNGWRWSHGIGASRLKKENPPPNFWKLLSARPTKELSESWLSKP
jgi:N-terminal domain of anti-restriction factor ArdC